MDLVKKQGDAITTKQDIMNPSKIWLTKSDPISPYFNGNQS